ncbi:alpha/beta fold hydrolase [Hymenobacter cellulosilyticus]|uniref:Alpha/beta hydrolase n=1 Tax=Hymenobacter cellulosilyticus TaxID=2932248 RepID=A0A8T9PYG4_9BACT|nr:alpha/beta fold hydrolase [Hymenobacter cellulosilyticus]UOQ70284.1 alpha/beta hydrolase [Hymenobacter cellulosilyticus]
MSTDFAQPVLVTLPDQRQLEVIRYGDPAHPAVLFHHGYASSGLSIPPNAELLAQLGLQIVAPNRPGSGRSDVHPAMTLESFAEDTVFALDALQITGPLTLLGWSAGGLYAQAQAALFPGRVAALHLLNTCLPWGSPKPTAPCRPAGKQSSFSTTTRPAWPNRFFAA